MQKLQLPHVILPTEFITLLKANSTFTTSAPVFDVIRPNKAIYFSLEKAFAEFDDGRGLEKTMVALGWSNFRDRMASMYIYKYMNGSFPAHTDMDLVEDIQDLEQRFVFHSVKSVSRVFLLGFYLKLANLQLQDRGDNHYLGVRVPDEIVEFLKLSNGRSEKIDWLILILMHLYHSLGGKLLLNSLASGKQFEEIYQLMSSEQKKMMLDNLLAYGASIKEADTFLYEKI